ncbi:MAG: histidine phosphatase family protein [Pirellulales bacterium]|nr:histidine phosphatase family protein [Pirellulales bacterium]
MLQIILIRPGSTDYDVQRRVQGNLDVPLNDQGAMEVARVIEEIRNRPMEVLYAPASEPAVQTATAISQALGVKLKKLDHLENLDQGLWQGVLIDEVRVKQPKVYRQWQERPETVCPPEGEMLSEADERVRAALARLEKRHRDGVIGLVLPEPMASLARRHLCQCELGDLWKATEDHGRWEILELGAKPLVHST